MKSSARIFPYPDSSGAFVADARWQQASWRVHEGVGDDWLKVWAAALGAREPAGNPHRERVQGIGEAICTGI